MENKTYILSEEKLNAIFKELKLDEDQKAFFISNYLSRFWDYISENPINNTNPAPLSKSISERDVEFIKDALNHYWHFANIELTKNSLGDIERKNYEYQKTKSKELMSLDLIRPSISDKGIKDWDFVFKEYAEQRANTLDLFEFLKFLKQHYPVPVSESDAVEFLDWVEDNPDLRFYAEKIVSNSDLYSLFLSRTINEGGKHG